MSSIAIRRAAPANPVIASVNTAQVFSQLSNPLLPLTLAVPGKLALESKQFRVRAEGTAKTAVDAYTIKATLLAGLVVPATPFTATNWTVLGAGTARAIGTAGTASWWIQADCIFDSTSGNLNGVFSQLANNLFDANAALAAVLAGINGTNVNVTQGGVVIPFTDPAFLFAVALTFGTANAANVGNLVNFELGF